MPILFFLFFQFLVQVLFLLGSLLYQLSLNRFRNSNFFGDNVIKGDDIFMLLYLFSGLIYFVDFFDNGMAQEISMV